MMDCLEPLFVINQLLLGNENRYIWGIDQEASELFVHLCELHIKVDGFICDEYKGTTLWNKPVLAYYDVNDSNIVLCISDKKSMNDIPVGQCKICHGIRTLNPKFDRKQAVIYGAGMVGTQLSEFLKANQIDVLCFVDSNVQMVGNQIGGVVINDMSYLGEVPDTAYVIEAGQYCQEIDAVVKKYFGGKRRFFWKDLLEKKMAKNPANINVDKGLYIDLQDVLWLKEFFGDKRYYLYGDRDLSLKYQQILELLGFPAEIVGDFVSDEEEKCIEDLLYEENYLILLVGTDTKELFRKMECLGFQEVRDYVWIETPFIWYNLSRKQMLDINLGYVYLMDEQYPGIKILGRNEKEDYKIAVLGGSTTDAECCPIRSWVDFLYEKCEKNNVTIYNGGADGYNSTMELLKLLRDILLLEPDMIIVYDGVNDSATNYEGYPYNNGYLERVLRLVTPECAVWGKSWNRQKSRTKLQINKGYLNEKDSFDIWVNNMELMYAIARSRGICFYSFLQPMLLSKPKASLTLKEKSWVNAERIFMPEKTFEGRQNYRRFMTEREIESTHDYMYDLSDIFDYKDVYLDECHVYEEGNQIIAEEIWRRIKTDVIA